MVRPRKPLLSKERIVAAATDLIDAEGLEALSIRRLAAVLGVSGPSLYNHFPTKDDILDAVADAISARVDVSVFQRCDWRIALRQWGRSYRDALAAHPHMAPLLASGPGRRPASLAIADAVYGGLVDAGWPPARATHVGALMRYFVVGSSVSSFARGFSDDPQVYTHQYPHLSQAHLLAERQESVDEGAFELGLHALISGLEAFYVTNIGPLAPLSPGEGDG